MPASEAPRLRRAAPAPSATGSSSVHASSSPASTIVAVARVPRAAAHGGCPAPMTRPSSTSTRGRRGRAGAGSPSPRPSFARRAPRAAAARSAPRCARRPRSSARRARGSPGRRAAPGSAPGAGAGLPRTSGRARRSTSSRPSGSASSDVLGVRHRDCLLDHAVVGAPPGVEHVAQRAREQPGSASLTTIRRRTVGNREVGKADVAERAHRPRRSARCGRRPPPSRAAPTETSAVRVPGSTTSPDCAVAERRPRPPVPRPAARGRARRARWRARRACASRRRASGSSCPPPRRRSGAG